MQHSISCIIKHLGNYFTASSRISAPFDLDQSSNCVLI